MYINLFEKRLESPLQPTNAWVWNIVNNHGEISIEKKDCFLCSDYITKGCFVIKMKKEDNKHDILAFPPKELCEYFNLDVDKYFDTSFIHYDRDVLRQEWNKRVDAMKLSKNIPIYLYGTEINDYSELLEFIKKNNFKFQEINLKTKKDNIVIEINNEDAFSEEILFFVNEDFIPNLDSYVKNSCWDDGIGGTISLEKFNQYIKDFGGIDLIETTLYCIEEKSEEELEEEIKSINNTPCETVQKFLMMDMFFEGGMNGYTQWLLPLLTDTSKKYLYELKSYKKVFAYNIIDEDNDFWYTENGKYPKCDIKNLPQFNPNKFDNFYSNNLDELIEVFNNNLEKFYLN